MALTISRSQYVRENIIEFLPTFSPHILKFFYAKLAVFCGSVILLSLLPGRRRTRPVVLLLIIGFGYLATQSIRYTAWFALVGAYILSVHLAGLPRHRVGRRALAVLGSLALAGGIGIPWESGNVRGMPIGFENRAPLSI